MKHDCQCFQANVNAGASIRECTIHPRCACGCERRRHADGIGECRSYVDSRCHGCPEYRPARLQKFEELTDDAVIATSDLAWIKTHYLALRSHHIEETTVLHARTRLFPYQEVGDETRAREVSEWYQRMLQLRNINVDSVCVICHGYGTRVYSNTSTWRGGIGGQAMTTGICDQCWGSGDREHPWTDLRTLNERTNEQVAERAVDALAHSCGATFETSKGSVQQIIDHLDALTRKRKVDGIWTVPLVNGLANILRRAIGVPEKELR